MAHRQRARRSPQRLAARPAARFRCAGGSRGLPCRLSCRPPVFLPVVIGLLANARVRHDAAEALTMYGAVGLDMLAGMLDDQDVALPLRRQIRAFWAASQTRRR